MLHWSAAFSSSNGNMAGVWRWFFNFAAGVSLLLCVALGAIWIRSNSARDVWEWNHEVDRKGAAYTRFLHIASDRGIIDASWRSSASFRPEFYEEDPPLRFEHLV